MQAQKRITSLLPQIEECCHTAFFAPCRYQGVDWRKKGNWACNQRLNPTGEHYFDGITLSAYELMFVKVKDTLLHSSGTQAKTAVRLQEWMDGLVSTLEHLQHLYWQLDWARGCTIPLADAHTWRCQGQRGQSPPACSIAAALQHRHFIMRLSIEHLHSSLWCNDTLGSMCWPAL